MGVSVGLFAPGWCWEHFSSTNDRKAAEQSLWRGVELDGGVKCDCKPGFWGGDVHRTREYLGNGVAQSAVEGLVGSEEGFWTEFERGFGVVGEGEKAVFGGKRFYSQLGAQGVLPVQAEEEEKEIWWAVDYERSGFLSIVGKSSTEETGQRYLKLYNLGIRVEEDTRLVIRYHRPRFSLPLSIAFLFRIHSSEGESQELVPLPVADLDDMPLSYTLSPVSGHYATITEIGITITGPLQSEQQKEALQISCFSIGSPSSFPSSSPIRISNIQLKIQGRDERKHGRLIWRLSHLPERPGEDDYWSEITGPIAYFEIGIDEAVVGRAYGLQFVLPDVIIDKWRGEGVVVEVCGVLFGGRKMGSVKVWLGEGVEEGIRMRMSSSGMAKLR